MPILLFPIVLVESALYPMATFPAPLLFDARVAFPIQVLLIPYHGHMSLGGVRGVGILIYSQLARPLASLMRTFPTHGVPPVIWSRPVILMSPFTSSFTVGLAIPIPIFH